LADVRTATIYNSAEIGAFFCTFEFDFCPFINNTNMTEQWLVVDGSGVVKDNTLSLG